MFREITIKYPLEGGREPGFWKGRKVDFKVLWGQKKKKQNMLVALSAQILVVIQSLASQDLGLFWDLGFVRLNSTSLWAGVERDNPAPSLLSLTAPFVLVEGMGGNLQIRWETNLHNKQNAQTRNILWNHPSEPTPSPTLSVGRLL